MSAALLAIARLRRAGRLDEAEAAVRAHLAEHAGDGAAWNELGHVLRTKGDAAAAEAAFARAVPLVARPLEPRVNLALMLVQRGALDAAATQLAAALQLAPDEPIVLSNLGALSRQQGQLDRAEELLEHALARAPDHAAAHVNLGLTLADRGDVAAALPHLERAVELAPAELGHHDSLLLHLHYIPVPRARIVAAHRRYGQIAAAMIAPMPPRPRDRDRERRLRVGLVSPDLRRHSVAFFVEPILRHHDRARLEFIAYSNAAVEDEVSARLRALCAGWQRVRPVSDAALAERVRADDIDVLVDLAGHTANNRLPLFARRPAPLQLSYLGYPDDTGLDAIDLRIGDRFTDGDGDRVLHLDAGFLCYAPPPEAPEVAPPPSLSGAPPTFASFNAPNKLSDAILAAWARILDGVPRSRLLLKLSRAGDGSVERRLRQRLAALGVADERVTVLPFHPSPRDHLAAYSAVDVALDAFPYHGATTTCDALWMGVPVVTLAGAEHVSRVGVSLLERAGLAALIATTPDEYVRLAIALAGDEERRRALRLDARSALLRHGLVDGPRAAAAFERAVRAAWTR